MFDNKSHFIEQCRLHFARNTGVSKLIDDFEMDYKPSLALSYYTRDGFMYRIVNKALRRRAVENVLNLRFFLCDIRAQLQSAYKIFNTLYFVGDWMIFFRGQRMSCEELEILKKKYQQGTLINTNSYLSASISREIALIFAGKATANLIPVLFEINAQFKDPDIQRSKPFAYIGQFSKYGPIELEVLFSVASFFKIDHIDHDDAMPVCTIKMTFIDDDEVKYTVTEDFRALRTCSPEVKIIKIGSLLSYYSLQDLSQAAIFYEIIQKRNFSLIFTAACYAGLGWLALRKKNENLAIECQEKALTFYKHLNKESENLTTLYVTSNNCIGTAMRIKKNYNEALNYYLKADELQVSKIPIDKYSMYDLYRNVASVNIASLYKQMGEIELAWEKYKKILASDMSSSKRVYGHIFLTIAQAGLQEALMAQDKTEYQRCVQTWQAFLDLSLTDMSSNYRRSIVSGVLLIGFEYATNKQTQNMAIDYFKKIIDISSKYINVSRDDYYIVLRCHLEIACLYRKTKRNYLYAIIEASNALQLCRKDDLESIGDCYKSMAETYEQLISEEDTNLTSDDISTKLCESFFKPLKIDYRSSKVSQTVTLTFKQSEFAFGQYTTNLNSSFPNENDHKRQLVYCYLKMAALAQNRSDIEESEARIKEQEEKFDIAQRHNKIRNDQLMSARQLLIKANSLIQDPYLQNICMNNMAYLNEDYDSIIDFYRKKLDDQQSLCISENLFCYIAHLFRRKNNDDEEKRWYCLAVEYFKSHVHICKDTEMCFTHLAKFHQRKQNYGFAIQTYESLVHYLIEHRPISFVHESVVRIVVPLIQYFAEQLQWESAIAISKHLIQLILKEDSDKIETYKEFQKIIESCNNIDKSIVIETYSSYLDVILRHQALSYPSYIRDIEPAFRQAINIYKSRHDYTTLISVYQNFLEVLISPTTKCSTAVAACKRLALILDRFRLVDAALDMYMRLGQYILTHGTKEDLDSVGFAIGRYRFLLKSGAAFNADYHRTVIQLMVYYRNTVDPQFIVNTYLATMVRNLRRNSIANSIYMDLVKLYMKYRPKQYEQHFQETINSLRERPNELIAFVITTRIDYTALIEALYQYLSTLNVAHNLLCLKDDMQSQTCFEADAELWLKQNFEMEDTVRYGKCLEYILELHSIDDEYLASSYISMDNKSRAASVFKKSVYGNIALKYNLNACHRYLRYTYNEKLSVEERTNVERDYGEHFILECDVVLGKYSVEIRSIQETCGEK